MLTDEMPYFMENRHWWTMNEDETMIVLTPEAPIDKDPKILESYKQYLRRNKFSHDCLGGIETFDFDIDDDAAFEKFINKMMKSL